MELDALPNAERAQALQPGKCGIARGAVDHVAFPEQEPRQIGTILPGDADDQCDLLAHAMDPIGLSFWRPLVLNHLRSIGIGASGAPGTLPPLRGRAGAAALTCASNRRDGRHHPWVSARFFSIVTA